jgi:hypothetical protein
MSGEFLMAGRNMTAAMDTEAGASRNMPVWFIRLDIDTDPLYIWTGYGQHTPSATGDTAFDGITFEGLGNIGTISPIRDTSKGSGAVNLELPGVDLQDTALNEIVNNARKWQYKPAWIWFGYLNTTLGVVVKPTRLKTGRMDNMVASVKKGVGVVTMTIESHQAHISQAQEIKMIDQKNLDPNDTSMDFIVALSNLRGGAGAPAETKVVTNATRSFDR